MKIMTKEWVKDIEFHDLIVMLKYASDKKMPFVFTNGGTDCIAKEDLHTVKTDFGVSEVNFIMLPDTFNLDTGETLNDEARTKVFLLEYLNRLRVISYIPENILKLVKDKKLLALGYAEKQAKREILKYIETKYKKAFDLYDECTENTVEAEKELTINKQSKVPKSLPLLFDGAEITKAKIAHNEIYLTLDNYFNVVFSGAKLIEQETDFANSVVRDIELYKTDNVYELHFLLMKTDTDFINRYYYATIAFKDLKFID